MSLDPMAFDLACLSSLSLSNFTVNSGDLGNHSSLFMLLYQFLWSLASAYPSPPSSVTGSTSTTTIATYPTSNGAYDHETAPCSQQDLDDLMNPFLPNVQALDIGTQLLSGPLLPNPLPQRYDLFASLETLMPAGFGPEQSIPPADSTWASTSSVQLDGTSALAPPARPHDNV